MKITGSHVIHALYDSLVLIGMITPVFYCFLLRPMNLYIAELKVVNQQITQMNTQLEQRVEDRTQELVELNRLLESDYTEALRLSEERYKAVINSLPLGVAMISPDLRVLNANSELRKWYSTADFASLPHCYSTFHGAEGPCEVCPVRRTFVDGLSHEKLFKLNDSTIQYRRIRTAPFYIKGEFVSVLEIIEDVTEQQNLLSTIRESNDKFSQLFNNVSDIVLVNELEGTLLGKIVEVNEAAIEKLGFNKNELLNRSPVELVPKDIIQQEDVIKLGVELAQHKRCSFESTFETKDGKRIFVEVNSTMIMLDGKPVILSVCRDISNRKQALSLVNKALEESEYRYRSLIEQSAEGIFIWDLNSKMIQEANTQLLNLLGYTEEQITTLKIEDIVSLQEGELDIYVEKLSRGDSVGGQRLYRSKSGNLIEVEVKVSPVNYGQSKVCLVNVRDVRDKNRAEKALTQSVENLKKTLKETVNALVTVTEKRDPYTAGHQQQVAKIAMTIAREMNLAPERIEAIDMAAKLHDIGKIYVPSDILNKPGRLTDAEMTIIRSHPEVSYEILSKIPFEVSIADIVLQHHERIDGSGYPKGLKENEILLEARILAVADVIEAMAAHRPYRPALGVEKAFEELLKHQGTLYDTEVVRAAVKVM